MKKLTYLLAILISACASNSVRLTESEQSAFLERHKLMTGSFKGNADMNTVMREVYCDEANLCFQIECRGRGESTKCWKTPITKSEFNASRATLMTTTDEQFSQDKVICLNSKEPIADRRSSCSRYLTSENRKIEFEPLAEFCNFSGVICTKNGKPWGKGRINIKERSQSASGSVVFKDEKSGSTNRFDFLSIR